jgi:hypothetical protein
VAGDAFAEDQAKIEEEGAAARTLAKTLASAKIGTTAAGKTAAEGCHVISASRAIRAFFNSVEGAFFKREMSHARQDKRIGQPVLFDTYRPVNTFWDIGMDDETAIWFHQTGAAPAGRFLQQV